MDNNLSEEELYKEEEEVLCVDVQQLIDQYQVALKFINIQKVNRKKFPENPIAFRKAISLCEIPSEVINKPLHHSSEGMLPINLKAANDFTEILKMVEFLETPKVSYNKTAMLLPVMVTPEDVQECTICACSLEGRSIKKEWVEQLLFGKWQGLNKHEWSIHSLKSFASSNSSFCSNDNSDGSSSSNYNSSKSKWSENRVIFSDDESEDIQ